MSASASEPSAILSRLTLSPSGPNLTNLPETFMKVESPRKAGCAASSRYARLRAVSYTTSAGVSERMPVSAM